MDVSLGNPAVRAHYDAATAGLPVAVAYIGDNKGKGVVTRRTLNAGETLWLEAPLVSMQHLENTASANVCNHCHRFLGSLADQIQFMCAYPQAPVDVVRALTTTCPAAVHIAAEMPGMVVPCAGGCGTLYCSVVCRDEAASAYHALLCVGPITDENHPLVLFKHHAVDTNEIFLLAARVIANIVSRWASNGGDLVAAALPYAVFANAPWWEIPHPEDMTTDHELVEFRQHLHRMISQSFELLRAALYREELAPVFTLDFFARIVGAFELNNVDMSFPSPLARLHDEIERMDEPLKTRASGIVAPIAARIAEVQAAREAAVVHGDDADCDDDGDGDEEGGEDDGGDWEDEDAGLGAVPGFDGTALCVLAGSMNHSCNPNVRVKAVVDGASGRMGVGAFALRDLAAGEELCFSYIDENKPVNERQLSLREYGFVCACDRCCAGL